MSRSVVTEGEEPIQTSGRLLHHPFSPTSILAMEGGRRDGKGGRKG